MKFRETLASFIYDVYDSIVLLFFKSPQNTEKTIAIVFLELLGDYYLWLDYGLQIVNKYSTENYKIKFICDSVVADVAKIHFPNVEIYFVERNLFLKSPTYRAKKLKELKSRITSSFTISPAYPRVSFGYIDSIVRALGSNALGHECVSKNRSKFSKWRSDRWYSFLMPPTPSLHQQQRHANLNRFLSMPSIFDKKSIELPVISLPQNNKNYFVIVPGCSDPLRQWPIEKFRDVGSYLLDKSDMTCIILGAKTETKLGLELEESLRGNVRNLIGKTSLNEFIQMVSKSKLVLSNDSSAAHIAESYDVPCINIVGGGNFGHCLPYPNSTTSNSVFTKMECFKCEWFCTYDLSKASCYPCIDGITVDMVKAKVDQVLKKLLAD